jgi:hypothetical protein
MRTINVIRAFISRGLPERKRNVMSAAGSGSCATCVMTVTSDSASTDELWISFRRNEQVMMATEQQNGSVSACGPNWAWHGGGKKNSCRSVCLFDLLRWKEILSSWQKTKKHKKITKEVMQMRHVVPDWRPHLRLYTETADRGRLHSDEISDCRLLD